MKPRHLAAVFCVIPLLYVLSCGPLIAFTERSIQISAKGKIVQGGELFKTVGEVYAPLLALARMSPAITTILGGYVNMWRAVIN